MRRQVHARHRRLLGSASFLGAKLSCLGGVSVVRFTLTSSGCLAGDRLRPSLPHAPHAQCQTSRSTLDNNFDSRTAGSRCRKVRSDHQSPHEPPYSHCRRRLSRRLHQRPPPPSSPPLRRPFLPPGGGGAAATTAPPAPPLPLLNIRRLCAVSPFHRAVRQARVHHAAAAATTARARAVKVGGQCANCEQRRAREK